MEYDAHLFFLLQHSYLVLCYIYNSITTNFSFHKNVSILSLKSLLIHRMREIRRNSSDQMLSSDFIFYLNDRYEPSRYPTVPKPFYTILCSLLRTMLYHVVKDKFFAIILSLKNYRKKMIHFLRLKK